MTLAKLEKATQMLIEAKSLDEVKHVIDIAEAAKTYAKAAKLGLDAQNHAAEIAILARRKAGEFLAQLERGGGTGRGNTMEKISNVGNLLSDYKETIEEAGISYQDANRWQQVASVPEETFKELITQTKEAGKELTTSGIIKEIQRANFIEKNNNKKIQPFPVGKYSVIYTDPPWPVGSIVMDKWESPIDDKYPVMSIEDITNLPVQELAADDCALFMWTTHTFLPDALNIIKEWGFKYFCCITWNKGSGWTQNGFHKMTELLLYAYKGKMNVDQYGKAIPTLIEEKKTYHSKKPDSIRDLIASKTPEPRIEMFARDSFEGWSTWGNEVTNG